ncbi:MAG: SPOR domain-containing protein [Patescibacteria group bacterium]
MSSTKAFALLAASLMLAPSVANAAEVKLNGGIHSGVSQGQGQGLNGGNGNSNNYTPTSAQPAKPQAQKTPDSHKPAPAPAHKPTPTPVVTQPATQPANNNVVVPTQQSNNQNQLQNQLQSSNNNLNQAGAAADAKASAVTGPSTSTAVTGPSTSNATGGTSLNKIGVENKNNVGVGVNANSQGGSVENSNASTSSSNGNTVNIKEGDHKTTIYNPGYTGNNGLSSLNSGNQGGFYFNSTVCGVSTGVVQSQTDNKVSSDSFGINTIFGGFGVGNTRSNPTIVKEHQPAARMLPTLVAVNSMYTASQFVTDADDASEIGALLLESSASEDAHDIKRTNKLANKLRNIQVNRTSCAPVQTNTDNGGSENGGNGNGHHNGGGKDDGFTGVDGGKTDEFEGQGNKF